eukprot:UN14001
MCEHNPAIVPDTVMLSILIDYQHQWQTFYIKEYDPVNWVQIIADLGGFVNLVLIIFGCLFVSQKLPVRPRWAVKERIWNPDELRSELVDDLQVLRDRTSIWDDKHEVELVELKTSSGKKISSTK